MDTIDDRNAIIEPLSKFWHKNKVATIDILRLDLLHPIVSGNKWYKLRLNIDDAKEKGYNTIVTFGGGFSNHLVATAFAAKMFGLNCIGIVRGKYATLTSTLIDCKNYGMQLIFVTKENYNNKNDKEWQKELLPDIEYAYIVPEGGANELGIKGAGLIGWYIKSDYTHIATAIGSGTTLVGIRNKLDASQQVLGFAPFKNGEYLKEQITDLISDGKKDSWEFFDNWNFGGFGKWNDALINFMNEFYYYNIIPLDIIYTSKMMYGIHELIHDNYFSNCDRILCVHSGGLQGNVSIKNKLIY